MDTVSRTKKPLASGAKQGKAGSGQRKKRKLTKVAHVEDEEVGLGLAVGDVSSEDMPVRLHSLVQDAPLKEILAPGVVSKLAARDATVSVNFNNKAPLVMLLEGIAPMLSDCAFKIACSDNTQFNQSAITGSKLQEDRKASTFSGIYIEALDTSHSCVIIGKIKAAVVISDGRVLTKDDMSFCVSVSTFLTHIKSVNASYFVQLYRTTGSSDLHLKLSSPSNGRHHRQMTLGTLNKESPTFGVNDIDYPHTVEFEVFELRNIVKLAKGINCAHMRFRILETKVSTGTHRSYFIVHIYGESSYDEHCFCSVTDVKEGEKLSPNTIVIRNSELIDMDDDPVNVSLRDLDEKFNDVFPVEFLNSFLKSIDRASVTIRLAQGRPMTMTTSLGDEESFLTYMLAPKTDPTTLPNDIKSFCTE